MLAGRKRHYTALPLVLQKCLQEAIIRLIVSGTQRVPVRVDSDHAGSQAINLQRLLKPGLSVEPDVRIR